MLACVSVALLLWCCGPASVSGLTRDYFLRIEEVWWNYAPSGMNLIQNRSLEEDEDAPDFLAPGPQRIGPVYMKAVYKQYTDATYREVVEKPEWLGYLGPLLMAEEGDTVRVTLRNTAFRPFSIHPHGLNYSKGNEGALYPDGTGPELKRDDAVPPGGTVRYEWTLTSHHSPAAGDEPCLARFYHSHVAAPKDMYSGLIGPLLICKPGSLDERGVKGVDHLFPLLLMVSDENFSWYLDKNIQRYIPNPDVGLKEDEDFKESNMMHGINGYLYGNLPGLSMCQGNNILWHMIGLGNEVDMHSVYFHGQILSVQNHHTDTVSLFAGSTAMARMVADNPGHWLLTCMVNDHLIAGMQALFEIKKCFAHVHKPRPHGNVRRYFIAAEEEMWDYAPITPTEGEANKFVTRGPSRIGSRYKKVRYVEYLDGNFLTKMIRSPEEQHLGILGPVMRAEEKDTISVVFKNNANQPFSIQPHGVQYSVEQDGTQYHNELAESHTEKKLRELRREQRVVTPPPAALVRPGMMHTYEWTVPVGAGPVQGEADCLTYLYYSGVDPVKDTNSGLVGPLLICRQGALQGGIQKNYNKEFHLMATVFDENESWFLDENIQNFTTEPVDKDDEKFKESNQMHAINGFVYWNLRGLTMCMGDKVSWHLSGLGSEKDINSLLFQGNRFIYRQTRRDSISVFPHISRTVTMEPDSSGRFEVLSPTVSHYTAGMRANYSVELCRFWQRQGEMMRHFKTFYIAAVETEWDYAPNRTWETELFLDHVKKPSHTFLDQQGGFIGSRYKKVVYRQFTDDQFTTPVERAADMEHLGIMGPMIHVDVGDKVAVVFKNMATNGRSYSIHAHGVKTESPDVKHTKPGETHTYYWYVNKNTGPTEKQEECSVSAYYSTVDVVKDMYSGLIGPLVICRRSLARTLGLKKEVEEFALLLLVFDENESWYLDDNIREHIGSPPPDLKDDDDFIESNKMHAINGYVYGNLNGLNMEVGDKVYWYLMGMGSDVDIHSVHWHGHSVEYKLGGGRHSTDVFELFPATFQTVKMRPEVPGSWLLHCHVVDHIKAGMEAMYTVTEKAKGRRG